MFTLALSVLTRRFSQWYKANTGSLTPSPPPQRHQFLIPRTCKCYLVSKGGLCRIFQWGDYLGLFGWALMPSLVSGKQGRFVRQKRRNQCDNSWVCAGKSGRFETGWEGRWGGPHMPYRPYGEHFAFPLSEVGARGGVLAGSGCHKKNTTDWVAQTTGIYFSQSGGCKVQDQGVSRYFSQ